MKKSVIFICLCCILVGLASCNSNDPSNEITIYGNVIDRTTGQPLYNVLIQEKNKVGGNTVTGYDGNYEFSLPLNGSSNGTYYLVASKDGYSTSEYELEMSHVDKDRRIKVDFQLVKESITYTGTVVDAQHNPIQGAHLSATYKTWTMDNYSAIGSTVISRTDGSYTLDLPLPRYNDKYWAQWSYRITAEKEGYTKLSYSMDQNADDMGKDFILNFTMLSNQVTITGKVTDSSGSAIRDAYLMICQFYNYTSSSYKDYCYVGTIMTDAEGRYSVSLSMESTSSRYYFFNMKKDGYQTLTKSLQLSSADGGKTYTFDFILTEQ